MSLKAVPITLMNGNDVLQEAIERLNINLAQLVAETSLWANPAVFRALKQKNGLGVWYPNRSRAKQSKVEGIDDPEILGDKNNYANYALKQALGLTRGGDVNFHVCHIWDSSCYDPQHHTCIANLVLVPRAISVLTDYDQLTIAALRYRSFELYGWFPENRQQPKKPENYPVVWIDPVSINPVIEARLKRSLTKGTRR